MQSIDHLLNEEVGVSVDLDRVSKKTGGKYASILVQLDGGYELEFFLSKDQSNLLRMLLAPKK